MKKYKIMVDCRIADDYIKGRISGIVYALTGMPKKEYSWERNAYYDWTLMFDAEKKEQAWAIADCLNKIYPGTYIGMIPIE